MISNTKWVLCPVCGNKTHTKIRTDTELIKFHRSESAMCYTGGIYPSRIAFVTASTAEETCNFSKICCRWLDSVLSLINSSPAMHFRFFPLPISFNIFFSILVKSSIMILSFSDGKQVPPWETRIKEDTRSLGVMFLLRKPLTPSFFASCLYTGRSYPVRMIIFKAGWDFKRSKAMERPYLSFKSPRLISIRTISIFFPKIIFSMS